MSQALTERYRPKILDDLIGQLAVKRRLLTFAAKAIPKAFIFAGPTGVGKTSAAHALARSLGLEPDGGLSLIEIGSGRATTETIDEVINTLAYRPFGGPWRFIIVDEADLMSPQAQQRWLSALENLGDCTIIVFTTNAPERMPARFLDRCERIDFRSSATDLAAPVDRLIADIWRKETGRSEGAPKVRDLAGVVDPSGTLSIRRAVMRLESLIRDPEGHPPARADESTEASANIATKRAELEASKPEGHSISVRGNQVYTGNYSGNRDRPRKLKLDGEPAFPKGATDEDREWFRWLEHAAGQARHPDDKAIIREAATRLVRMMSEAKRAKNSKG